MTYVKAIIPVQRDRLWLAICTSILLLGAILRLVMLADVPPGLAQDEVLDADIAQFIRAGEHALFFRHGYGHEPLYHYWATPFQALLGDNVLSVRLPAVAMGMLLIALALRWARRDFGITAAVVAGFGLAVSWWPIVFSRIGIRPIMEPVVLLCAVLCWPRAEHVGTRKGLLRAATAGALLGLTLYVYTASRVLLALPALYGLNCWVLHWWNSHTRRAAGKPEPRFNYKQQATNALVALVTMVAVGLPLYFTLRADPTLQQRVDQLSGPLDALRQGDVRPILATSLATLGYFGLTGDPRWTYAIPNQPLFAPVAAVLFLAGLGLALWRWRNPAYAFVIIWLEVALVPSMVTPDAPSSVRLVGALPVFYLLPGVAVAAVFWWAQHRPRNARLASAVAAVAIGALALSTLGRTISMGFGRWPSDLETRLKYQSILLDISRDPRLRRGSPVVADSFFEPIDDASLRRNLNADPQARWVQSGQAVDGALIWPHGGEDTSPALLFVPEFAPINAELLAAAAVSGPLDRSAGKPSYATYELSAPPDRAAGATTYALDGQGMIELLGVFVPEATVGAAGDAPLVLFSDWRVAATLPNDLAIFVHLVDGAGNVVAQFDGLDAAAATLQPGDRVLQRHVIDLPEIEPGEVLTVRVGLYSRSSGTRLTAAGGDDALDIARCRNVSTGAGGSPQVACDLPTGW